MTSSKSLFKFSSVEAKTANPATIRERVHYTLTVDDDACATAIEPYLMPPGKSGSREWDHALAINTLLEHDAKHGGELAELMDEAHMSPRMLWDWLVRVYTTAGFRFSHGRMVGLLQDQSIKTNDNDREDGIE